MKAAIYERFGGPLYVTNVDDPSPKPDGVVIEVKATGLCRSDWHGWMGHDDDITLPHIPGHELAGIISAVGKEVKRWKTGTRVTLPFVCGCGECTQCLSGNHQICDHQFQPGFTHWGSFAEYVAIDHADANLVGLPDEIDDVSAASLGCRFGTSFRAIVDQGKVTSGQWVAVHGCGGVGLSAIMIATALGAHVIAIDIDDDKLELAKSLGAVTAINATTSEDIIGSVVEITSGGVHVSLDALGSPVTCFNSISNLRKQGKHIQVGLMTSDPLVPIRKVISDELEILGSHGIQSSRYSEILTMIKNGQLNPEKLVGKKISLEQSVEELVKLNEFDGTGMTVIDRF